jgi:hypothetical protein
VLSSRDVLPVMNAYVITFTTVELPAQGTALNVAYDKQKAGASAAPTFSLLRLSAFARCGGALIVIAGLWAVVCWALA